MAKPLFHPKKAQIDLCTVLYALSDPRRLEIVKTLLKKDATSCKATCARGQISKSTLSHHFKILREAGIVESEKNGVEYVNRVRLSELNERFPGLISHIIKSDR